MKIPTYLYWDDTPDPPSGLSIEKGHIFRSAEEKLCIPVDKYLTAAEGEEIENGYMFSDDEYNKIKYESPSVRQLMECQVFIANITNHSSTQAFLFMKIHYRLSRPQWRLKILIKCLNSTRGKL